MSPSVSPSSYHPSIRRIELTLSIVILVAVAVIGASVSSTLDEFAFTVGFFAPVLLAVVALVGAVIDIHGIVWTPSDPRSGRMRLGLAILAGIIFLLALATIVVVIQTVLILTVIDTGGGVILGPLLWLATGVALSVLILVRYVIETRLGQGRLQAVVNADG